MSIVQFGSLGFSKVSNLFYKAESYSEHQFDLSNSELLNTALHIVALITSSLFVESSISILSCKRFQINLFISPD